MKGLVVAIALSVALVGCSGHLGPATTAPTIAPSTFDGTGDSTPPSEAPAGGTTTQKVGDKVDISCNDADCLTVSVDKIQTAKIYKDPQHILDDTVATQGDLFLAFHVTYKATGPNANYNPLDWGVYVNDEIDQVDTFVQYGPKPELSIGDLPQGKTASGWIVQEIPPTGRVVIAYQPSQADLFEVVARAK